MTLQIKALLLALAIGSVLAQLEPDIADTTSPGPKLGSMLQQAARQRTTISNMNPTTSTTTTSTIITELPVTARQQQQQRATGVPSQSVTVAGPQEPSQLTSAPQSTAKPSFQYVKPIVAPPKCNYNNQTYSVGQKWREDCVKVCECVLADGPNSQAISACRDRCPVYVDPPGEGCSLQRSKLDECCLDWQCDTEGKQAPSTTTTIMNTERGQLNVSTTEIKLPSSQSPVQSNQPDLLPATTTSMPQTSFASAATLATTTINTATLPSQSATQPPKDRKPKPATTTTQQQVPTTTVTNQLVSFASVPPNPPAATTSTANLPSSGIRSPKRAPLQREPIQVTITGQPPVELPTTTIYPHHRDSNNFSFPKEPSVMLSSQTPASVPTTTTTTTTATYESSMASEEVDPVEFDLCIQPDLSAFKIGQIWSDETCGQTCRCVFKSEPKNMASDLFVRVSHNDKPDSEETEIRCGQPSNCPLQYDLTSTPECPNPRLILPQPQLLDKCACPKVACSTIRTQNQPTSITQLRPLLGQPTSLAPTITPSSTTRPNVDLPVEGCRPKQLGARLLNFGETFNDECHSTCRCFESGEIRCQPLACPVNPPEDINCDDWIQEPNFRPNSTENKCCAPFVCRKLEPRFKSCSLMGKEIEHGQKVPETIQPTNPGCEKVCTCQDGKIVCQSVCPVIGNLPPENFDCPLGQAFKANYECCPQWQCRVLDYVLQGFEVQPTNATAVNVRLVLPDIAEGREGRIELNFTEVPFSEGVGLLPHPKAYWSRRANIRPEHGVFTKTITYQMSKLKPNHIYWFSVAVHFSDSPSPPFDEPLKSDLLRVVMPSLEPEESDSTEVPVFVSPANAQSTPSSTTTTTTTTSTTTVPPTMILHPVAPNNRASNGPSPPALRSSKSTPRPVVPVASTTTSTTTTATPSTTVGPIAANEQSSQPVDASSTNSSITSTTVTQTFSGDIIKPEVSLNQSPCSKQGSDLTNDIDGARSPSTAPVYWPTGNQLQDYALQLLVALVVMTILFLGACCACLKKSARVIAPISSQSAYDNPTFTKLVSYYPPHVLLVDENNQNYNNDAILAKQKNLEVDKSSPLHHHQMNDIHHHNGRQHLI